MATPWINRMCYAGPVVRRRSMRWRLRHFYYAHEEALWILASVGVVAAMAWAL